MPVLSSTNKSFEVSVPVIIVGGGACGLTAALAASDLGVSALVLEKDKSPNGTTSMSQGTMCAAGTNAQQSAGIQDSPEIFFKDIVSKVNGKTDRDYARTISREAGPSIDWLNLKHNIPFEVDRSWKGLGHSIQRLHAPPKKTGTNLMDLLLKAIGNTEVDLLSGANVTDIYADSNGLVRGVCISRPDGGVEDIGCNALIIATCGFASNPDMIRDYIPEMSDKQVFTWENSLGDGIKWGMDLGGSIADMSAYQGYGALAHPHQLLFNYNYIIDGGVMVNSDGNRFSNETADVSGQGFKVLQQPGQCAFMIYDEALHKRYRHLYESTQAIEVGAVKSGETINELSTILGINQVNLKQTLQDISHLKNTSNNDIWGRSFSGFPKMLAPYYGIRVTGALYHTLGGLEVDSNAQVRKVGGGVLPNVFAGGGAARGISGPTASGYLPASGICMAITLGRLAGEGAAKYSLTCK
ncbi:MAG: 3-ketosteroid dehydrogenase [Rhodospirillaceae bacterium]|nr:3-ketosteroid dehydrogenase [Rhodospirillaceae bacterium]